MEGSIRRNIIFLLLLFGASILGAETLRIGVFIHSPVVMQDAPGREPYGPGIDYAKAVARALGYEPKFELHPIARVLSYLEKGSIDMSLEFGIIEERKSFLFFADKPCYLNNASLTILAENPLNSLSSNADIAGMRIGYILGAYQGVFFEGAKGVTFDYATGDYWIPQNLGKLLARRIDAILDQNMYSCLFEARKQGVENKIKVLKIPGGGFEGYVVFSRAAPKGESLLRAYNAMNASAARIDENALIREYIESAEK
jgi:ABC-type amino acid transport substrate-binding protein